jgi:carbon storage regulator CsrA
MLILVRKAQQGIWIEGGIWVKVLSVERDRVKLGIEAPGNVKVMRQELFGEGEDPAPPPGSTHEGDAPAVANGHSRDVH